MTPGDGVDHCQHSQTPETTHRYVDDCIKGSALSPLHSVAHKGETVGGFHTTATKMSDSSDNTVSDTTMRDCVMSCVSFVHLFGRVRPVSAFVKLPVFRTVD